ncbi:MAG: hypothetical protein Q9183_005889, partial [Haloplaca sp. 2 TL-2023]
GTTFVLASDDDPSNAISDTCQIVLNVELTVEAIFDEVDQTRKVDTSIRKLDGLSAGS